ncbi:ark1 [Symbiodinium microadriaticum]|nr:ark1 [Symbiodinium microadriaticum]
MQRVQVLHSVQVPPLQNARQINNAAYWPPVQTIGAKKTPRSRSPPEDVKLSDFEMLDGQGGRSLGKGSFGVVRRIRRKGTDDVYALKTMQKAEVVNGQLVEQVEREIQVQRTLKHENVLRLYKHFEDEDTVYLLLEYCAKGELYQLLRTQKGRKFSEQMSKHFFVQLVRGLKYLHSHQIVHRDLKPENLLVTHDDVLKIGDFGWCAATNVLRTTFCGTMDYLAPEMIQGSGHNHTLDIWSVGILLYEMMADCSDFFVNTVVVFILYSSSHVATASKKCRVVRLVRLHEVGRPPFQSTNHTMLIDRILKIAIFFPPGLPPLVVDLVRRLLKRDPAQRLPLEQVLRHPWVVGTSGEAAAFPARHPVLRLAAPLSVDPCVQSAQAFERHGGDEQALAEKWPRSFVREGAKHGLATPPGIRSSAAAPVQPQGSPVLSTPKMPQRSEQAARKPAWPTQASGYQAHRPLASPTGTPVLTRRGVAPVSGYPGNSFAATRAAAQNLSPPAPAARAVGGEASTRQSRRQSPDARTNGTLPQRHSTSLRPSPSPAPMSFCPQMMPK